MWKYLAVLTLALMSAPTWAQTADRTVIRVEWCGPEAAVAGDEGECRWITLTVVNGLDCPTARDNPDMALGAVAMGRALGRTGGEYELSCPDPAAVTGVIE